MIHPQPKPLKRRTVKRKKKTAKRKNVSSVRDFVAKRDVDCRIQMALKQFTLGYIGFVPWGMELDWAHLRARGMGGNPDLTRDTSANTMMVWPTLHTGPYSLHSGHIKIRALTDRGADGPCCFEFYEQLPSEIRK